MIGFWSTALLSPLYTLLYDSAGQKNPHWNHNMGYATAMQQHLQKNSSSFISSLPSCRRKHLAGRGGAPP